MTDAIFKEKGTQNFPTLKVPKQCPFAILVKIFWRKGRALRSAERK
jgi:hypothetical protein